MGEWQPIETAPKDGTEILTVRLGEADSYEVQHWFEIKQFEYVEQPNGLFEKVERQPYDGWSQNGHRATHWMPLPPMPSGQGEPR